MTRDVITVHEQMPVASALALYAEKRVKRLPVVNAKGELVGILGTRGNDAALFACPIPKRVFDIRRKPSA